MILRQCIANLETTIDEMKQTSSDSSRLMPLQRALGILKLMTEKHTPEFNCQVLSHYLVGVTRALYDATDEQLGRILPARYLQRSASGSRTFDAFVALYKAGLLNYSNTYKLMRFGKITTTSNSQIIVDLDSNDLLNQNVFDLIFNLDNLDTCVQAQREHQPSPHGVLANLYIAFHANVPFHKFTLLASNTKTCWSAFDLYNLLTGRNLFTPRVRKAFCDELEHGQEVMQALDMIDNVAVVTLDVFASEQHLSDIIPAAKYFNFSLTTALISYRLLNPETFSQLCDALVSSEGRLNNLVVLLWKNRLFNRDVYLKLIEQISFIKSMYAAIVALQYVGKLNKEFLTRLIANPERALLIVLDEIKLDGMLTLKNDKNFENTCPQALNTIKSFLNIAISAPYFYLNLRRNREQQHTLLFQFPPELLEKIIKLNADPNYLEQKTIAAVIRERGPKS